MTTPTPPCLGEREAVARTIRRAFVFSGSYPKGDAADFASELVIVGHIDPLRTENETLRATAIEWRRARLAACAAPIGTPSVWAELGSAEAALSEAIRALTTPEPPKT